MINKNPLIKWLRNGDWLDDEAARVYRAMLAIIFLLTYIGWYALSRSGLDPLGKPLGTDFLSFWTASQLALGGNPAGPYDVALHSAAQKALFDVNQGYSAFFYPPIYLLLCLPLATLPYISALGVWLGVSGIAYAGMVRRLLNNSKGWWLTLLAFPAVLLNLGHGQNGFITASLIGGGILLLDRRPWLAGILFGCLAIKPHFGLLIPFALAARGLWRPFIAAGLTVAVLGLISLAAFGMDSWQAFLANTAFARRTLETGLVEPGKMQSTFAAVRVLHGSLGLAYGLQAIVTIGTIATIIAIARARLSPGAQGAALATGALIATPFVLDYDLTWMAIPLAWLFIEARRTQSLPWERLVMGAAFLLPLVSRALALKFALPIAPLVLIALFWAVVRRGYVTASPCRHSHAASGR